MIGLTRNVELLGSKIDCGIQHLDQKLDSLESRIELRLDDCARRLGERFDEVDRKFESLRDNFRNHLAAFRGLPKTPEPSSLSKHIVRFELDIDQLFPHESH